VKKLLLLILVIVITAAGCSKAQNANNVESNTYAASPVPETTLSGVVESTAGNADKAENDASDTSPESDMTLSDIIEASSVICAGKIIDGRDIDQNTKAVNVAVTRELKGAIEETKIELYTQKPLRPGYMYIFFLCENSRKYNVLSIASCDEYDGTILYDEALVLDVDYENIDKIAELKEYIQKGNI
jgi:hypothetical protein